jgi:hypothetical protein
VQANTLKYRLHADAALSLVTLGLVDTCAELSALASTITYNKPLCHGCTRAIVLCV